MENKLFDEYNIRARLCPSLILLSPIILNMYLIFESVRELSTTVIITIVSFSILNLLILVSRQKGSNAIKGILDDSTAAYKLLSPNDKRLDKYTKERYYKLIYENLPDLGLITEDLDEDEINQKCKSAINWLRSRTRDKNKFNLVNEENINTGFCRNMYGFKWWGIVINSVLILILLMYIYLTFKTSFLEVPMEFILSIMIDTCFLFIWIFIINKKFVKSIYSKYSYALLNSCDIS